MRATVIHAYIHIPPPKREEKKRTKRNVFESHRIMTIRRYMTQRQVLVCVRVGNIETQEREREGRGAERGRSEKRKKENRIKLY